MQHLNSAMQRMALGLSLLALATSSGDAMATTKEPPLICTDGVYRLSPPGIAAAVYFNLKNPSAAKVTLASATSAISDRIEVHRSGMEKGMMIMERLEELPLSQGQTIAFKPGSYHLMVFHPKRELALGDKVTFTLTTKSGKTAPCETVVKKEY